jgi:adenylate cyclase
MTVRLKIHSIAVALLVVFGIVIGISAVLQSQVSSDIAGISRYHQPLASAMANFDVISDDYELELLRLLRLPDLDKAQIDSINERERRVAAEMEQDFATADTVIAKAVADDELPIGEPPRFRPPARPGLAAARQSPGLCEGRPGHDAGAQ